MPQQEDQRTDKCQVVVEAQQGSTIADLPGRIWGTFSTLLLKTPRGFGEGLWRFFAITFISSVTFGLWMAWRYPVVITNLLNPAPLTSIEERFRRSPEAERRTMELLGHFISQYQPTDIALINWISQTGIVEIWADPRDTSGWPTATNGVMSSNMTEAVGLMIFDLCWSGDLGDGGMWAVCGLSNHEDIWGYVIVRFEDGQCPKAAKEHLRILAARLEGILFVQ